MGRALWPAQTQLVVFAESSRFRLSCGLCADSSGPSPPLLPRLVDPLTEAGEPSGTARLTVGDGGLVNEAVENGHRKVKELRPFVVRDAVLVPLVADPNGPDVGDQDVSGEPGEALVGPYRVGADAEALAVLTVDGIRCD
ncbi:hypothetical protein GCM10027030_27840 [Luteococcus sediminum]